MRKVFADSGYWIALLSPNDGLHHKAKQLSNDIGACLIVTSEMVLVEVLNHFARNGESIRRATADMIDQIWNDPNVEIVRQTSQQFDSAYKRYSARIDQRWSLTDCSSFLLMEEKDIREALAHDRDFEQAGFVALLREAGSRDRRTR